MKRVNLAKKAGLFLTMLAVSATFVVDRTTGKGTNTKGDDIDLTLK